MTHHFGPIELIKGIEEQYKDYLVSTFHTDNNVLNGEIEHKIRDEYQFFKGPYIQMADIYSTGESIKALVSDGVLSDKFLELNSKKLPIDRPLYSHQVRSIKNVVVRDHNTVISTGTGSGKTEGFLIPILNHIMEEGDEIALPGVRAMIIYPMNALVNDQMRRLSEVLYYYQKIKFGFFTGETKGLKTIEDYRSRFGRDPGSNELFKEDDLRKSPPHILITNYSMLEHILIRYENSVEIFNKDNAARWKYIVLDEVHTYGGATGIEVSMLLRRVLATIDNNSVRFILTSATLGDEDSNEEVADFASNLTSQHFEDSDVIRADRILRSEPQECDSQSFELYEGIWDRIHHGSGATESDSIAVLLDSLFWKIYHVLSDKDNCHTIESLGALTGLQCSDVEKFIDVVNTLKDENGHKLIDSKYHTFVKALEGIYFTLGPSFKTSLTKTNVIMDDSHGREFPAFNLAVCFNCNAVFVPGRINNKYQLVNSNDVDEDSEGMSSSELFYLCSPDDYDSGSPELFFQVCAGCRSITPWGSKKCSCDGSFTNYLKKMEPSSRGNKYCECPKCGTRNTRFGIVRDFYLGFEAASTVLSSALFEKMPEPSWDGEKKPRPIKQFLMFSDSRKSASYAAVNLSESYSNLLMRRNLYELVANRSRESFDIGVGVGRSRKMLRDIIHDQFIIKDQKTLDEAESLSYGAISDELVCRRSNKSLENLGLFRFEYRDHGIIVPGLGDDECDSFVSTVIKLFRDTGAIDGNYGSAESNRDYSMPRGIRWAKRYGDPGDPAFILEPSEKGSNSVYRYIFKIVGDGNYTRVQAELGRMRCFRDTKDGKALDPEMLTIVRSESIYKCGICGRFSAHSVRRICPYCLNESLNLIDSPIYTSNDHYVKRYREMPLERLEVREHTAQLVKEDASAYQNQFLNQELNVLSCSTTFEMGVDIGDLQYVFMRNVPPSPSNYAQRAGRAGRGADISAFILTFCKTNPHDSTFFKDPPKMIAGKIRVPRFSIDNPKIVIRHIFATALGFFWRTVMRSPSNAKEFMDESGHLSGLRQYLFDGDDSLDRFLSRIVPSNLADYSDGGIDIRLSERGWVDTLISDTDGRLTLLRDQYTSDHDPIKNKMDELFHEGKHSSTTPYSTALKTIEGIDALSFLSSGNIIPRYGFPVDIVKLTSSNYFNPWQKDTLDLQRDLSLAISEYAPGCQVVANGKLITSTNIKILKDHAWPLYAYSVCSGCKTISAERIAKRTDKPKILTCKHCGETSTEIGYLISPIFGFSYSGKPQKATVNKPHRSRGVIGYYKGTEKVGRLKELRIGNLDIDLLINSDDEFIVLSRDTYFICPFCGYGSTKKEKTHKKGDTKCNGDMQPAKLSHMFLTDSAIISFGMNFDEISALSILYALINGLCELFNLDRDEVDGMIRPDGDSYDFILYDKTPGGSGYVKSLNEKTIRGIIENARDVVANCSCGGKEGDSSCYSCLCDYYNQTYHDKLKRGKALRCLSEMLSLMGDVDGCRGRFQAEVHCRANKQFVSRGSIAV